jgi:hypothetical protein
VARQREAEVVQMTVHHVKRIELAQHFPQDHRPGRSEVSVGRLLMPDRPVARRYQACRSQRVSGRKQGHLMAAPHELLSERMDDTLGASVADGRDTFQGRRKLCDPHPETVPPLGQFGARSRSGFLEPAIEHAPSTTRIPSTKS